MISAASLHKHMDIADKTTLSLFRFPQERPDPTGAACRKPGTATDSRQRILHEHVAIGPAWPALPRKTTGGSHSAAWKNGQKTVEIAIVIYNLLSIA